MKLRNSNCAIRNGFTLLEVVVAMAIVGLGVTTLFEIFSLGLRLGTRSSERTEATAYSRQAIDEMLIRQRVGDGGEEGSFGEKYRWSIQVKPFQEDAPFSSTGWGLKEVSLKMRFREGDRERDMELRTLRLVRKKGP